MAAAPERDDDARRALEERIRAMQFEQVPLEGGAPKARVGLASAYFVTTIATFLPLRLRTAFGLAINFVFNQTSAVFRFFLALLSSAVTGVAIAAVYWLVLGPTALWLRLVGRDDLRVRLVEGSTFTDKDPPDATEDRFLRQY